MNYVLPLMLIAGFSAAQDSEHMTPSEVRAAMQKEMRGAQEGGPPELIANPSVYDRALRIHESVSLPSVVPPPAPPGIVSAARLRHKVPKRAMKAFERAAKESGAGNYAEAVRELEDAVAADPEFAEAHANLGVQYLRLARLSEAAAEFERSIALDPTAPQVHTNLAVVRLRLGESAKAEASARQSLAISSTNDKARYVLALAIGGKIETREEAIQQLELAARTMPAAERLLEYLRGNQAPTDVR